MSDIELIGKIIAESLSENGTIQSSLTSKTAQGFADTVVISSDNEKFYVHKAVIQARWPNLLFESTDDSSPKWYLNLELPSLIVSLLIDFLYYRPLSFPSLDSALHLYTFASEALNHHLQKLCIVGIKENLTPNDVLKVWNYSKCHRLRNGVLDYVTYHFSSSFDTDEAVRNEFTSMSLNDVAHILRQRKLNIQSEREIMKFAMSWVDANISTLDPLKAINTFIDCIRLQKDHAKHVIPHMLDVNEKYFIDCKCPSIKLPKRIRRDLFIFYGLFNQRNPIAFFVDVDAQKIRRLPSLDNPDYSVPVPNFTISNGTIYQVGGNSATAIIGFAKTDCYVLDKNSLKWKRKSSLVYSRAYSSVCSSPCGKIFVVGGQSYPRNYNKRVEMYDPEENSWKFLPRMNFGRFKAATVYYDEKLIVIGGAIENRSLVECEFFTKFSQNWIALPPLNHARSGHTSVIYGNHVYAMGGNNFNDHLTSVERLSLDFNSTWKEMPPMTAKRTNFTAEVFDNKLFVFGGEMHEFGFYVEQTVEFFDGNTWHPFCVLPPDVKPLAALSWKNIPHPEMLLKNELKPELYTIQEDETSNSNTSIQDADLITNMSFC